MNGIKNFDKTDREYSLDPTDDVIRFWRSKVKVRVGIEVMSWAHHIS